MSSHDPFHPRPARRRRAKDPFDPKTRKLIDRMLTARPVPAPVPNPSNIAHRRWVLRQRPEDIHRIACERLHARWSLIRDAFLFWDSDRLDEMRAERTRKERGALAGLRFPSLIVFLQCITIDDPVIERAGRLFPMMSADRPAEITGPMREQDVAYVGHHPNSVENLCARFHDTFLREWLYHPSSDGPCDEHLFTEYQALYQELRQQQRQVGAARPGNSKPQPAFARRRIWAETVAGLLSAPTVTLAKKAYAVPHDWTDYVSSSCPPAELARVLLARAWRYDFQDVKERLVRLRREVPVRQVWTNYEQWLHAHPERLKELEVLIRGWPGILAPSKSRVAPRRRRRIASSSAHRYSPPPTRGRAVEMSPPLLRWPRDWPHDAEPDAPKDILSAPTPRDIPSAPNSQ